MTPEWIGDRVDEIIESRSLSEAHDLLVTVLEAVERRDCEDVSCCAFVALKLKGMRP
jgi:hypothetical protein